MFVYIFSRINPGADKRESSSHVQEQCNILLCRLKQCMHLELRAVLFNTCSVKKKKSLLCVARKKVEMFLITELTRGTAGNGMRTEAAFPFSFSLLLTLFSPLLACLHSDTPPSASPPLHGLPTPPLSRREREGRQRKKKSVR